MLKKITFIILTYISILLNAQNDKNITVKDGITEDTKGNITSYKNGKLHGKQVKIEGYSNRKEISYYDNGEIQKKEYNYIWLENEENPTGIYKNGKPYDGYFPVKMQEILLVDFYKKGKKKYQYSKENVIQFKNDILSIKSEYKNGRIYDGRSYDFSEQNQYLKIDYLKKGKVVQQIFWVFAVHYANAFTIHYTKNGYTITEKRDKNVKVIRKQDRISFFYKEKEVLFISLLKNTLASKDIGYYEINGNLKEIVRNGLQFSSKDEKDIDDSYFRSLLFKIFMELRYEKNSDTNIPSIIKNIKNSQHEDVFAQITYDTI
ncbi:hypothetical protein [Tenacibaculum jejuense]|uniref:Uncharacterized protein n=1 Tax=Tenacibaculum jejuense TaxID=584609 RepID=A0A238U8P6_9FLAO|nr:hypothetical protein [Tenacibaculum jejuense]SNR15573.1 Protein of unknown function precursor [Tenacibaculum jejuense]